MNLCKEIKWNKLFHHCVSVVGRLSQTATKWGKRLDSTTVPLLTRELANGSQENREHRRDLCSYSIKSLSLLIFYEHQEEKKTLKPPAIQECIWYTSLSLFMRCKKCYFYFIDCLCNVHIYHCLFIRHNSLLKETNEQQLGHTFPTLTLHLKAGQLKSPVGSFLGSFSVWEHS